MSSIGSAPPSSTPPPEYVIDNLGGGNYRVMNPLDKDGDGVTDGEAMNSEDAKITSGTKGIVMNAQGLNALFAESGISHLSANGPNITGSDGAAITPANNSVYTDPGTFPLPVSASGSFAEGSNAPVTIGPPSTWGQQVEDGALMWLAMRTMAELAQRDITDQRMIRDQMQTMKQQAQQNSIDAQRRKIEAERSAAMFTAVTSVVAAGVSFFAGTGQMGEGAYGASQALGTSINAIGTAINKTSGPQAEADDAELENQRWQMMMTLFETVEDDAKSGLDAAREEYKKALQIVAEHVERESQANQRITSA